MIVISLGRRCEVAWQIRHHLDQKTAFPFDWLVTPLQSIRSMIEEGFAHIADPEALDLSYYCHPFTGARLETVINRRYDVFLHHEFERRDGRIVPDWRATIETVQAKWAHIAANWDTALACGEPIVLVRQGGRLSLPSEASLPTEQAHYEEVRDLIRKRAKGPISMLVVDGECPLDDGFITARIGSPTLDDTLASTDYWQGSPARWGALLRTIRAPV